MADKNFTPDGYDNSNDDDDEETDVIEIEFEDGTKNLCHVIAKFDLNDITYAALLPDELEDENVEILIYRYSEDGDSVDLEEITDEDEFSSVADALDEIIDDIEFNFEED